MEQVRSESRILEEVRRVRQSVKFLELQVAVVHSDKFSNLDPRLGARIWILDGKLEALLDFAKVMETKCRSMMHETTWITKSLGATPAQSSQLVSEGPEFVRGCTEDRRLSFFCLSMAGGAFGRRRVGVDAQAGARAASQA